MNTWPPIRSAQCAARAASSSGRPDARDSAANADTDSASSLAELTIRSRSARE